MSRFARIYPVYLLGLLMWLPIAAFLVLSGEKSLLKTLISLPLNLALVQSWSGATALSWNAPGWSLSVEALFYLLFPFILPTLLNRKLSTLIFLASGAFGLGMLAPVMYSMLRPDGLDPAQWPHAYYTEAPFLLTVKFMPILRLPEFVLGIVVGLIHQKIPLRPSARFDLLAFGLFGLIVAVLTGVHGVGFIFLHNGLLAPLFGFLILCLARSTFLARMGEAKLPVLLGESSYSLYIIHGPVLIAMTKIVRPNGAWSDLALVAIYVLAVVLLSVIVFKCLEKPLRAKILGRAAVPTPLAPVSPMTT
jgi:peptidoglycan/LPS O-acetylase OafA/YrhL